MILPRHVCFKGDNGKYLSARKVEWNLNYLQFSSDDIADATVRNIIHTNSDGTIRIYSYVTTVSSGGAAPTGYGLTPMTPPVRILIPCSE